MRRPQTSHRRRHQNSSRQSTKASSTITYNTTPSIKKRTRRSVNFRKPSTKYHTTSHDVVLITLNVTILRNRSGAQDQRLTCTPTTHTTRQGEHKANLSFGPIGQQNHSLWPQGVQQDEWGRSPLLTPQRGERNQPRASSLKCAMWNVNDLGDKRGYIKQILDEQQLDILVIYRNEAGKRHLPILRSRL